MLADANARVGESAVAAIGGHGAEPFTYAGREFEAALAKLGLALPATYGAHADTETPSYTWCHYSGATGRIDYVAIPRPWLNAKCRATTLVGVDLGSRKPDHLPVMVRISAETEAGQEGVKPTPPVCDTAALANEAVRAELSR